MTGDADNIAPLRPQPDPILRCRGAARSVLNDQALIFRFDRRPSDEEMRFLEDVMRRAAIMARCGDDDGR